jgi:SAM-dependent methyltransferase
VRNTRFEVADTTTYKDFDLVAFFDCLHHMAGPDGAARHARQALKPDGNCMSVGPLAGDHVENNLNPVGRVYYGASALICVPVSLDKRGPALGAQTGEQRLRAVVEQAGFTGFRRASETLFNIALEAHP